MNVNDVDMNGEASGSNTDQATERISNNPACNDCGKHFGIAVGGARPKVRHLVSNIPNGIAHISDDEAAKVNNNVVNKICDEGGDKTNPNNDVPINTIHNGLNSNCSNSVDQDLNVDSVLRNNVNCHAAVDKCPLSSRPCSMKGNGTDSLPTGSYGNYAERDEPEDLNLRRNSSSSSDTGNEGEDGLSADECCIYTYKGDQMADLPSSFFRLDVLAGGEQAEAADAVRNRLEGEDGGRQSRSSSPEMDFLEMDFDPGPSCDQDSEEESDHGELQEEAAAYSNHSENLLPEPEPESCNKQEARNDLNAAAGSNNNSLDNASPSPSPLSPEEQNISVEASCSTNQDPSSSWSVTNNCSNEGAVGNSLLHRTPANCWPYRDAWGHHCSSGDLCSPCGEGEEQCWSDTLALWNSGTLKMQAEGLLDMRTYNLHSALYHCIMAKRLVLDKQASLNEIDENTECKFEDNSDDVKSPVERVMIWSEQEACVKQVTQISTSACGATAVINVLLALNITFSLDKLKESVGTRLRADTAPLPQYLFSRSVAGATHIDIIRGLQQASEGTLYARFFHMFPDRVVSLTRWLAYWMKKGAIPIATLNLQNGIGPGNTVPDAWHHQMVFGVGPRGIYLTNPVECVSEAALWPQLCSPSVLLVKRNDVLSRWNEHTNLRLLMSHPDNRWKKMNVLGQVVNVIRESMCSRIQTQGRVITQHVAIPASYCSGITLAISREAPGYEELQSALELPLL
ncbi:Uncharacterized protein GBIM_11541 [Gryllus bimaculatus]|nr:Uncharacterized protein GBIM_11541 [Gryllus bimaculatus]